MESVAASVEEDVNQAIARLDFDGVRRTYQTQDEFIYLPELFPLRIIESLRGEALGLGPRVVRNHVPFVRKGGFVGYQTLQERAPAIVAAYRSAALVSLLSRLVGRPLYLKSESDPHSCVLYYYTKPGDHLGYHYDTCGCERGSSYTALIGLRDRSTQIVDCHLFKENPLRPTLRIPVKTTPGSLVAFNGSTVWHGVTRLGRGEERVVLSLSYRTDRPMTPVRRWRETWKDRLLFSGLGDFLPGKRG
ncbi:MAG: 2OG-Fe(II) oxygenase [Myxococcales bacterium]|nr:2OG-Fe(II) oxygenase [Myxococcales bacterium]